MSDRKTFGALRSLWEELRFSLCKLNQIQFSAPWNARHPTC